MIGVSAGGLDALCTILAASSRRTFALPIVVVQHRSKDSRALCEVLEACTAPRRGGRRQGGHRPRPRLLAPPDYHLLVEEGFFSLSVDAPEMYSRPSIDVAFQSAADAYGAGWSAWC
jgi:two-component system, chemotaxis family, protein-glutamate methylesterase/glutaminase